MSAQYSTKISAENGTKLEAAADVEGRRADCGLLEAVKRDACPRHRTWLLKHVGRRHVMQDEWARARVGNQREHGARIRVD